MAIYETRAYRSGKEEDAAAARFWLKIFTATFALGVATGITMEFSFGTNWADYSRFVGDIFGAPLAAEALLAFFLESTFLGVLLFGRKHVGKKFYLVSAWLVFIGSAFSALWIIIANSWMQTPGAQSLPMREPCGAHELLRRGFQPVNAHTLLARDLCGAHHGRVHDHGGCGMVYAQEGS